MDMALALIQDTWGGRKKVTSPFLHSAFGEAAREKDVSMEPHKCILPHVKTFFWQVTSSTSFPSKNAQEYNASRSLLPAM